MANGTTPAPANSPPSSPGPGFVDLVSTQKGASQTLAAIAQSIANVLPVNSGSTVSPKATGVNNIGTSAGTSVIGSSTSRHSMLFHNPGSNDVYLYPSALAGISTSALGGTLRIVPGDTVTLPAVMYGNLNSAFSAIALTGTTNSLSIWEFF